jgi:NAD(P)-dependent dehydrogenase (short-subunit alcohol dehydrogenase family)
MRILEGKVAVLSGATSGIGARIAQLFAEEGATVVIGGRREDRGRRLAETLGARASFVRADVAVEADVAAMIEHAVACFGRVDCLVNNAGTHGTRVSTFDAIDLDQFDRTLAVHLRGTLAGIKHVGAVMARQGSGSIINTASINGIRAGLGRIDYSVAKAAVIHLTRCAAVDLGERGIRVNGLSPGPIATGIFGKGAGLDPDAADLTIDAARSAIARVLPQLQPLPHIGMADDVARAALFLASDASRLITGQNLVVDGGISVGWPAAFMRDSLAAFIGTFNAERSALAQEPGVRLADESGQPETS